jgi:hypothetical protein
MSAAVGVIAGMVLLYFFLAARQKARYGKVRWFK